MTEDGARECMGWMREGGYDYVLCAVGGGRERFGITAVQAEENGDWRCLFQPV